jgi:hypothetical protein
MDLKDSAKHTRCSQFSLFPLRRLSRLESNERMIEITWAHYQSTDVKHWDSRCN